MLSGIHLSTVLKDSDILSEETTHLLVTSLPKPDSCLSRSPTTIRAIAALPARRRPLTHRWSDLAILRPQKTKRRDNELQFVDLEGCGPRFSWFDVYINIEAMAGKPRLGEDNIPPTTILGKNISQKCVYSFCCRRSRRSKIQSRSESLQHFVMFLVSRVRNFSFLSFGSPETD